MENRITACLDNPTYLDLKRTGIDKVSDNETFVRLPFNPNYYISSEGRAYSLHRHRLLTPQLYGNQEKVNNLYYSYRIKGVDGKYRNYRAHVLVARYFVPKGGKDFKCVVHHRDSNKLNNTYTNLQWVDYCEHGLLESKLIKKLYLYNFATGTFREFHSLRDLEETIQGKYTGRTYFRLYSRKPDFKCFNGLDGFILEGLEYRGMPVCVAVEFDEGYERTIRHDKKPDNNTSEKKLGVFGGLILGGLLLYVFAKSVLDTREKNIER